MPIYWTFIPTFIHEVEKKFFVIIDRKKEQMLDKIK